MQPKESTEPTKSILLSKAHDITLFASTDATRYVLNGVHYNAEKKRLEATNGRIMVTIPVIEDEGEFPPVQAEGKPVDCIIPTATFQKAVKNIPNGNSLPILKHALMTCQKDGNGHAKVSLTTNDLDNEQTVTGKTIDGQFPQVDQVGPKEDLKPTVRIALAAEYLKSIADYALRHGTGNCPVVLSIIDPLSPVTFEVNTANNLKMEGVLMPVRIG